MLQVIVTYLAGALYMSPFVIFKHQHYNRVRSKLFVTCQRWWFQWRFWFVPSVPGIQWYVTKTWCVVLLNKKIHIFPSQVYSNVHDMLLKPRQSFRITLYMWYNNQIFTSIHIFSYIPTQSNFNGKMKNICISQNWDSSIQKNKKKELATELLMPWNRKINFVTPLAANLSTAKIIHKRDANFPSPLFKYVDIG